MVYDNIQEPPYSACWISGGLVRCFSLQTTSLSTTNLYWLWYLQDQVARKAVLTPWQLHGAFGDVRTAVLDAYPGGLPEGSPVQKATALPDDQTETQVRLTLMLTNIIIPLVPELKPLLQCMHEFHASLKAHV